jgi:hypothetical protein
MRKLTRLQALIAGTAFAAAGVLGTPLSAMAADSHPATSTTDQVVTNHVGSTLNPLTSTAPTTPGTSAAPSAANASSPATTLTAPVAAPTAPSDADLHPVPVTAAQTTTTPDHDQLANAKAIMQAAKDMNLPPRAYEIAVATSLQESNLHNLGDLGAKNDHDSLGLFQQRTGTGGWGTPDQIMDPHHAATAFLTRLVNIDGWDSMPLTQAAQKVQVSAYPQAYAKHETQAGNIIDALYGTGPYADQATDLR